jgi:hypothetical protein
MAPNLYISNAPPAGVDAIASQRLAGICQSARVLSVSDTNFARRAEGRHVQFITLLARVENMQTRWSVCRMYVGPLRNKVHAACLTCRRSAAAVLCPSSKLSRRKKPYTWWARIGKKSSDMRRRTPYVFKIDENHQSNPQRLSIRLSVFDSK